MPPRLPANNKTLLKVVHYETIFKTKIPNKYTAKQLCRFCGACSKEATNIYYYRFHCGLVVEHYCQEHCPPR